MKMSIKEMLQLEDMKELRLVSGFDGVQRIITNINIMDNPDTISWLKEGELLLTTGYSFVDRPEALEGLVEALDERGCSGLGLKLHRYFEEVPQALIDASERLHFPIIAIPYAYSLSHVSNVIYKEIFNVQKIMLQKSFSIHKRLTEIASQGGDLVAIAEEVVRLVENPVMMIDEGGALLAFADAPHNVIKLARYLNLKKGQRPFSSAFLEDLPKEKLIRIAVKKELLVGGKKVVIRIRPIIGGGRHFGYIAVWELVRKLERIDYIAMEHAATVSTIELLKEKEVEEARHRMRRDFFDDLLDGRITSERVVENLCEIHGLQPQGIYAVGVLKILDYGEDIAELTRMRRQMAEVIQSVAKDLQRAVTTVYRGNQIVLFIELPKKAEEVDRLQAIKGFGGRLFEELVMIVSGESLKIGFGRAYDEILAVGKSFSEAVEVIELDRKLGGTTTLCFYDDYLVYNLLSLVDKKEEIRRFYDATVAKVVEHDRENSSQLVETLDAFFRSNGNISEAAKASFVHRNTFIYRLDKIKQLLGTELKDPDELLALQIGLKTMRLIN